MRIFAGEPGADNLACYYYPVAGTGVRRRLGTARGFDSDEKWVEVFIMMPHPEEPGWRCMTSNGKVQTTRLFIDYDIVDKATGETLYSVRQE